MDILSNGIWKDEVNYKDEERIEYLYKFSDYLWRWNMSATELVHDINKMDLKDPYTSSFKYPIRDYTLMVPEEML